MSIYTKDVMDAAVVNSVQNVPEIGEEEEQFKNPVKGSDSLRQANLLQIS